MPPEIMFSNKRKPIYSNKCDVYSMGIILHELYYKCHPYDYEEGLMKR